MDKVQELIDLLREKKREQRNGLLIWVFGVVLAICVIAAIAYAVYRYFTPDYLEDFQDEDFEDDFDAYFEEEEPKIVPMKKKEEPAAPEEEPAKNGQAAEEAPAEEDKKEEPEA